MSHRVFVALDTPDIARAEAVAAAVKGKVGGIKIGKEFFTALGPQGARQVRAAAGLPLFLDLKFHDIPNTVASAIRSSLALKPFIVNVHAAGGAAMLKGAAEAAKEAGEARPLVIAVTVLTSLGDDDMKDIGVSSTAAEQVVRLAKLTQDCGLDGVVCSAKEITAIREACGSDFKLVVPGIRPSWAAANDQRRVLTPKEALDLGADYLVIGRPITGAADPGEAAARIAEEIAGA